MIASPASRLRSMFAGFATSHRWRLVRFSSSSAAAAAAAWCPRNRPANFFESEPVAGESAIYRHSLKYTRPPTLNERSLRPNLFNSASFIGTVELPLKTIATLSGRFGVHTRLRVSSVSDSHRSFRIHLQLRDELAKTAFEHLKVDDFIYVSGCLGSYEKVLLDGTLKTCYKITARELNYVKQHENVQKVHKSELADGGESWPEKYRKRLHLWQIFFANPFEWYDCRRSKAHQRQPDFKSKHTHEALWLNVDDPPWVRKQLQLHDSRMARGSKEEDSYF
ncbi:Protein osb1, mitochondrial-like [Dionaea muscipula]